jgi:hypothetical protein
LLWRRLRVAQALEETAGGARHAVEIAQHLDMGGPRRGGLLGGAGAQEKSGIFQQAFSHLPRAVREGRAQFANLTAAQLGLDTRRGQAQAVLRAAPGNRHQMTHRRVGGEDAAAHLLLHLDGQLRNQRQTP